MKCESHTEHEHGQNNLLMRNRKTETYMGAGESQLVIRGRSAPDCPDHELPDMTGQYRQQEEPRRHPEP